MHEVLFRIERICATRFLGHMSQRLQWPIVIMRCPTSVRPSVRLSVRLFTFSTSSPEPLDSILMKLGTDEVLKVPYKCCCFSARSVQGRIQGGAKIGHRGSPSSRNFFFRPEGYSNKPNTKQWSRSMWEEVLLFLVLFWSQIFDVFLTFFFFFWLSKICFI